MDLPRLVRLPLSLPQLPAPVARRSQPPRLERRQMRRRLPLQRPRQNPRSRRLQATRPLRSLLSHQLVKQPQARPRSRRQSASQKERWKHRAAQLKRQLIRQAMTLLSRLLGLPIPLLQLRPRLTVPTSPILQALTSTLLSVLLLRFGNCFENCTA